MAHNLFIAYDLMSPGQSYDRVRDAIKGLGQWYQFQYSLFYVHTKFSPTQAYEAILLAMDPNDRLAVIDAATGIVSNWDNPPIAEISTLWNRP